MDMFLRRETLNFRQKCKIMCWWILEPASDTKDMQQVFLTTDPDIV